MTAPDRPTGTPRNPAVGGDNWSPTVGGGSSGGGSNKRGSGLFVFPLPIELGLLFLVLFLGTWGPS